MSLPPGLLAGELVLAAPEFVMAGSRAIRDELLGFVNQKPSYSALVQWLQQDVALAEPIAKALHPDGQPSTVPVPLPPGLLDALGAVWADLEAVAFGDLSLQGLCWTVQQGIVPTQEPVSPADGNWRLQPFTPTGGISFPSVGYTRDRTFSLELVNALPRHVCAYATFLREGRPVPPETWATRLPVDVPRAFESATTKFLAAIGPNAAVSAIPVDTAPQKLSFPLPANADRARIVFGGLGIDGLDPLQGAAGIILTYALDFAVPWIVSRFPDADPSATAKWYRALLADASIRDAIIASGAFIITSGTITGIAGLLDALSAGFTALFLGGPLKPLRDSIDGQFGKANDQASPSGAFAATLGWPAQIVGAMIGRTPATQSWISQVGASSAIELSASTSVDLRVRITPSPHHGSWPYSMAAYEVSIGYGDVNGSFRQVQSGPASAASAGPAVEVSFGNVRNAGIFDVAASLLDGDGQALASGSLLVVDLDAPPAVRIRNATLAALEPSVKIDGNTRFVLDRTLNFNNGAYVWETKSDRLRTAVEGLAGNPTGLVGITLQEAAQSIGYVWNASGQPIDSCSGGGTLTQAYLMQNIGTIVPGSQLMTLPCGFIQQPYLAYGRGSLDGSMGSTPGVFLDPREPAPYLRQVTFGAGSFDLGQSVCRGKFREEPLDSIAIHPDGYAVAVSAVNCRLEILRLSDALVDDVAAPQSRIFGGSGRRPGLLLGPIAVAITPSGFVLVLEQGNARIQAFDIQGNSVSLFDCSPFITLQEGAGAQYQDLAVSPSGRIYVLWADAMGVTALDIFGADGGFLCRTSGIDAGRITVDSRDSVYALNDASITGPGGRLEPSISVWIPSVS